MTVRRVAMIACALLLLVQSGCARKTTQPSVTQVDISVAASPATGSPALPVVADARVVNTGNTNVFHCVGCGCGNGLNFTVLGPDGNAVLLTDPHAPVPLCGDWFAALEPGSGLANRLTFTGTLYTPGSPGYPSPTYEAPAGTYTVVARFIYRHESETAVTVERTTTFVWEP